MTGHLRNWGNPLAGGTDTALYRNNPLIGGCLTAKAGKMLEQMNKVVASEIGGASNSDSLKSSYSPDESEILGNNKGLTMYNRVGDRKETALEVRLSVQEVTLPQSVRNINRVEYPTYTINRQKYKGVYDESGNEYWLPKEKYDEIVSSSNQEDVQSIPQSTSWDMTQAQDTQNTNNNDEYSSLYCASSEEYDISMSNKAQPLGLARPGMKIIMQPTAFALDADAHTDPASIYNYAKNNFNSLPKSIQDKVQEAGKFLVEWGIKYGEVLLKKAPLPPNVQLAIAVGFFMINVCKVANAVQKRRADEIDRLQKEENYKPDAAIWEAEGKVNGWLLEEIGEVMIEDALDTVLAEVPIALRAEVRTALVAAWNRFVENAKAGKWERKEMSL